MEISQTQQETPSCTNRIPYWTKAKPSTQAAKTFIPKYKISWAETKSNYRIQLNSRT